MAAPDHLRENSRLQGEQHRGWSAWMKATVPPDSNGRNLEPRGSRQVDVEAALGNLAEFCGNMNGRQRELDPISLTMFFYMLDVRVSFVNLKN